MRHLLSSFSLSPVGFSADTRKASVVVDHHPEARVAGLAVSDAARRRQTRRPSRQSPRASALGAHHYLSSRPGPGAGAGKYIRSRVCPRYLLAPGHRSCMAKLPCRPRDTRGWPVRRVEGGTHGSCRLSTPVVTAPGRGDMLPAGLQILIVKSVSVPRTCSPRFLRLSGRPERSVITPARRKHDRHSIPSANLPIDEQVQKYGSFLDS